MASSRLVFPELFRSATMLIRPAGDSLSCLSAREIADFKPLKHVPPVSSVRMWLREQRDG